MDLYLATQLTLSVCDGSTLLTVATITETVTNSSQTAPAQNNSQLNNGTEDDSNFDDSSSGGSVRTSVDGDQQLNTATSAGEEKNQLRNILTSSWNMSSPGEGKD